MDTESNTTVSQCEDDSLQVHNNSDGTVRANCTLTYTPGGTLTATYHLQVLVHPGAWRSEVFTTQLGKYIRPKITYCMFPLIYRFAKMPLLKTLYLPIKKKLVLFYYFYILDFLPTYLLGTLRGE
jgi:hypothetical protein